jgi:hypothetical protein
MQSLQLELEKTAQERSVHVNLVSPANTSEK